MGSLSTLRVWLNRLVVDLDWVFLHLPVVVCEWDCLLDVVRPSLALSVADGSTYEQLSVTSLVCHECDVIYILLRQR